VRAYILDSKDPARIKAIVGVEKGLNDGHGIEAVVYSGVLDSPVIRSVLTLIEAYLEDGAPSGAPPFIIPGAQDELLQFLGVVGQYAKTHVDLAIESIPLERMVSLTRFVREYKYKQMHHLIELYSKNNIPLFASASVRFQNGKHSILTPPVVEEAGGKFVLVEGSTRATYCRDSGAYDALKCVVVRGVKDPLPSEVVQFHQVRVVGRTLRAAERYSGFAYDNFRHIENSVHPLNSLD
jgi:hypothetical protein